MQLHPTEELIAELRAGRMVVLMDDEDRENEGDLIIAAESIRAEDVNFMVRYGRGLVCVTLTREHCRRLNLPLMARNTHGSHATNFTVSIEAAEGVTTGISAADRALTIRKAAAADAKPSDLSQPGHVFPLMAHPGGVLSRAGHTEAGCDLARLAGFQPSAAIVEILNDDGSMARRADLEKFATGHGLKIGTIADLIRYRIETEKTVERVSECEFTRNGGRYRLYTYRDALKGDLHFALAKGTIRPDVPVLVRVHLENPVYDLTMGIPQGRRWPIHEALERLDGADAGVLVVLCNQFEQSALLEQVERLRAGSGGSRQGDSGNAREYRTIGLGSQILSDLAVRKMRVLSSPIRVHALSGFGLEIVEYVESQAP